MSAYRAVGSLAIRFRSVFSGFIGPVGCDAVSRAGPTRTVVSHFRSDREPSPRLLRDIVPTDRVSRRIERRSDRSPFRCC